MGQKKNVLKTHQLWNETAQQLFTCSYLIIVTLEKVVTFVQG